MRIEARPSDRMCVLQGDDMTTEKASNLSPMIFKIVTFVKIRRVDNVNDRLGARGSAQDFPERENHRRELVSQTDELQMRQVDQADIGNGTITVVLAECIVQRELFEVGTSH